MYRVFGYYRYLHRLQNHQKIKLYHVNLRVNRGRIVRNAELWGDLLL